VRFSLLFSRALGVSQRFNHNLRCRLRPGCELRFQLRLMGFHLLDSLDEAFAFGFVEADLLVFCSLDLLFQVLLLQG
jgi:hypothetical protein